MHQASASDEDLAAQQEIRQRLIQRLVVAICLIVLVALAITLMNQFEKPASESRPSAQINPIQAQAPPEPAKRPAEAPAPAPAPEPAPSGEDAQSLHLGDATAAASTTLEPTATTTAASVPAAPVPAAASQPAPAAGKAETVPSDPDGASAGQAVATAAPTAPASTATRPAQVAALQPQPVPAQTAAPRQTAPAVASSTPSARNAADPNLRLASIPTRPAPPIPPNAPQVVAGMPLRTAIMPPQYRTETPKPTPEHAITALAAGALPAGSQGYTVQAGVFQSSDNAGKLIVRLESAGIPARIETRVQIGPFKTKEEADLIAGRLRQLGITPVMQASAQ